MTPRTPRPLLRLPRLRTRGPSEFPRKVTWLELFFDVVFVAAIAQVGEPFAHDYTPAGLVRYLAFFALVWWAWVGQTLFLTRFDPDDGAQRVLTCAQMCAVAVMAANATQALDSRESAGFAAAYAAMRALLALQYGRAAHAEPWCALARRYALGTALGAVAWLAAALLPVEARLAGWAVALAVDVVTPLAAERHAVDAPPHPEHLPERLGLFVLILLGECVVAVMKGIESQNAWTPAAALRAFGSVGMLWLLWARYFDGPALAARPIRTRADARRLVVWAYAHMPLTAALAVTGAGLGHVIMRSGPAALSLGEAAMLAGALAVVALSLRVIHASSVAPAATPPAAA
jgi:low temperature requirement protein LtrA